jgi:hypothetical protein
MGTWRIAVDLEKISAFLGHSNGRPLGPVYVGQYQRPLEKLILINHCLVELMPDSSLASSRPGSCQMYKPRYRSVERILSGGLRHQRRA